MAFQGRKFLALLLVLSLVAGLFPSLSSTVHAEDSAADPPPSESVEGSGYCSDDNGFISYYVREEDGAFAILPSAQAFDAKRALSFASFQIDGRELRFGGNYDGLSQGFLPPFRNAEGTTQTTWYVAGYTITQYLNIIADEQSADSYAVYIGYEILDSAGLRATLPTRLLLDTQFGPLDDQPVIASGYGGFISSETEFTDIPSYLRVDENLSTEAPYAYHLLVDARFAAPDKVQVGSFERLASADFSYQPQTDLDFTALGDSGLALYYHLDEAAASDLPLGSIFGFRALSDTSPGSAQPDRSALTSSETDAASVNSSADPLLSLSPIDLDSPALRSAVPAQNFAAIMPMAIEQHVPTHACYGVVTSDFYEARSAEDASNALNAYVPFGFHEEAGSEQARLWKIVGEEDGALVLLQEYRLEDHGFAIYKGEDTLPTRNYWNGSDIYNYLNTADSAGNSFVDYFWGAELKAIAPSRVTVLYMDGVESPDRGSNDADFYLPAFFYSATTGTYEVSWSATQVDQENKRIAADDLIFKDLSGTAHEWWTRTPATTFTGVDLATINEDGNKSSLVTIDYNQGNSSTKAAVRPVFRLWTANIVYASPLDEMGNTQLTLFNLDLGGVKAQVPDSARITVYNDPADPQRSYTLTDLVSTTPDLATGDYSINYKIIGDVDNEPYLLSYGATEIHSGVTGIVAEDHESLVLDIGQLEPGEYTVYYWLQRNNELGSHEAGRISTLVLEVLRDEYEIVEHLDDADSLTVAASAYASGKYRSGDIVTISNVAVDAPEQNKPYLLAFGIKNGASINLDITAHEDGSYSFVMPPSDVQLYLYRLGKESRLISVGPSDHIILRLDTYVGRPGDTVQMTLDPSNPDYYAVSAHVYKTWAELDLSSDSTVQETTYSTQSYTKLLETIEIDGKRTASFVIPSDLGEGNLLIEVQSAEVPHHTIAFPATLVSQNYPPETGLDPVAFGIVPAVTSAWSLETDRFESQAFRPGQTVSVTLVSESPYWGFDLTAIEHGAAKLPFTASSRAAAGRYTLTLSFQMPAFTGISSWQNQEIVIRLEPRRLIMPLSISSLAANAGNYTDLNSITVQGQGLERTIGKGYDIQEMDAAQKAAAQQIRFGQNADVSLNVQLAPTDITVQADGSLLLSMAAAKQALASPSGNTFYLTVADVTRSLILETDSRVRNLPFSVLGVVGSQQHYAVILADSDTDLKQKAQAKDQDIYLTIKGDVSYDIAKARYLFAAGKTMFNSSFTYTLGADSQLYVTEAQGSVSIVGQKGEVAVPGHSFGQSLPMSCTLKAGTVYDRTEFAAENSGKENVSIDWSFNGAGETALSIAAALGMKAEIHAFKLIDKSIVYSGKLSLSVPANPEYLEFAGIDIQRLQYDIDDKGQAVQKGVAAHGRIGMPENFELGQLLDFAAEVEVTIDTFQNIYLFDVNVNLQVLEFEGRLYLIPINSGALVPDELMLFGAGDPGIPIIPPLPLAYLKGLGGGWTGLADTINRDTYKYVPPLMLYLRGRVSVLQLVDMDAELGFGFSGISYTAEPSIGKGPFSFKLGKISGSMQISDSRFAFTAGVDYSLIAGFEVIKAGGSVSLSRSFSKNSSFQFSGRLYGTVQVPRINLVLFSVGPITLADAILLVDNSGVSGSAKIIKLFTVHFSCSWSGTPHVGKKKRSLMPGPQPGDSLETVTPLYDEDGEYLGEWRVGSNLTLVSLRAQPQPERSPLLRSPAAPTDDSVWRIESSDFNGDDIHLAEVALSREQLLVEYSDDGGQSWTTHNLIYPRATPPTPAAPYTKEELDVDVVNALEATGSDGNPTGIVLMLDPSISREWRITNLDGTFFEGAVIKAEPLPLLDSVSYDGDQLQWEAVDLQTDKADDFYRLDVFLADTLADTQTAGSETTMLPLLQDEPVLVGGDGSASGSWSQADLLSDLPPDLPSGDYTLWVYLKSDKGTENVETVTGVDDEGKPIVETTAEPRYELLDAKAAASSYHHTNALQPSPVEKTTLRVAPAGDGFLQASWNSVGADVYYRIAIYDESGTLPILGEALSDSAPQPLTFSVSPDRANEGAFSELLSGLPVGASYTLAITPIAQLSKELTVDGDSWPIHYEIEGVTTWADPVLLPVPQPPQLDVRFVDAIASESEAEVSVFSAGNYSLLVDSDQTCDLTLTIDSVIAATATQVTSFAYDFDVSAGQNSAFVQLKAKNSDGDTGFYYYTYSLDNDAPVLFVEADKSNAIVADTSGRFTVQGTTKPHARLSLFLDEPAFSQATDDGSFHLLGQLSADQQSQSSDQRLVTVASQDAVGNQATATVRVLLLQEFQEDIVSLDIKPQGPISIRVGESINIGAAAHTRGGQSYDLYGSALSYRISEGASALQLDPDSGKAVGGAVGTAKLQVSLTNGRGDVIESAELIVTVTPRSSSSAIVAPNSPGGYRVRYLANGGSGSMSEDSVAAGTAYSLRSNAFSRSGYRFVGWSTTADGLGSSYQAGQTIERLRNPLTLYAQWQKAYVVRYLPNGGQGTATEATADENDGIILSASDFTYEGYTFIGWASSPNDDAAVYPAGEHLRLDRDTDFYARWQEARQPEETETQPDAGVTLGREALSFDPDNRCFRYRADISSGQAELLVSAALLAELRREVEAELGNADGFTIRLDTDRASLLVPLTLADIVSGLDDLLAERQLEQADLVFALRLTDRSDDAELLDTLRQRYPQSQLISAAIDFTILVQDSEGRFITEAVAFDQEITRLLPLHVTALDDTEAVFVDAEGPRFVAHRFLQAEGIWQALISRRSNSTYYALRNPVAFSDLADDHWANWAISKAASKGLVVGVGENRYDPERSVSRSEFVQMLSNALSLPVASAPAPYTDTEGWYRQAIDNAFAAGLLSSFTGSEFHPNQPLQRQEMAVLLAAAAQYRKLSTAASVDLNARFVDADDMSERCTTAIADVVALGWMVGMSEDAFSPTSLSTRAQAAAVLVNVFTTLNELG